MLSMNTTCFIIYTRKKSDIDFCTGTVLEICTGYNIMLCVSVLMQIVILSTCSERAFIYLMKKYINLELTKKLERETGKFS